MAGGKKKKAAKPKKKPKNNGEKRKAPRKTGRKEGRSRARAARSARCNVDVFTEVAMENAYSTCHNVQDLLKWRGFPWPEAQKKKKKGKK